MVRVPLLAVRLFIPGTPRRVLIGFRPFPHAFNWFLRLGACVHLWYRLREVHPFSKLEWGSSRVTTRREMATKHPEFNSNEESLGGPPQLWCVGVLRCRDAGRGIRHRGVLFGLGKPFGPLVFSPLVR
mgnify:CR=1 FL=1